MNTEKIIATKKSRWDSVYLQLIQISEHKWIIKQVIIDENRVKIVAEECVTFSTELGGLSVEVNTNRSWWLDDLLEVITFGKEILDNT